MTEYRIDTAATAHHVLILFDCSWSTLHRSRYTANQSVNSESTDHDRCIPSNTRHSPSAGLMLGHRLRRWFNIKPALGECLVFDGWVLSWDVGINCSPIQLLVCCPDQVSAYTLSIRISTHRRLHKTIHRFTSVRERTALRWEWTQHAAHSNLVSML